MAGARLSHRWGVQVGPPVSRRQSRGERGMREACIQGMRHAMGMLGAACEHMDHVHVAYTQ